MEKVLKDYYYNEKTGYLSVYKLYKKLKPIYPDLKLKTVSDFVEKQYTAQVNKPTKKPKEYSSIISPFPKNNYQMDIIIYDRYQYKNYKYILCVIDVYSRYAACRALTRREMSQVIPAVKSIFDEMGVPNNMNCDNEFNNTEMNKFMSDNNVKVWFSQPNELNKNAIIERFNRTIAEMLQKWRTATGKYNWPTVLKSIVDNYNETFHNTIKETPKNVFTNKSRSFQDIKIVNYKFKVGDIVRIKFVKKVFYKNDLLKYSPETYIITKINGERIYLKNIKTENELEGYYKPYQLKLVNEIQNIPEKTSQENEFKKNTVVKKIVKALRKEKLTDSLTKNEVIIPKKRAVKPVIIDDEYISTKPVKAADRIIKIPIIRIINPGETNEKFKRTVEIDAKNIIEGKRNRRQVN